MLSLRRLAFRGLILLLALLSAAPAEAQVGGPPTGPVTLWQFLGIPQGIRKLRGATANRRGNRPNREPQPPLKAIADPANLESKDASIKKAAEIKQAEDLKMQKIKAVKYLASIGCGCYDVDGGVTAALVASMSDCTEDVRLETIKAIQEAAEGGSCSSCGSVCCCNRDILMALAKIAYERDEHGCYLEPSEEVREIAAETLRTCCPNDTSPVIVQEAPPVVPPDRETLEEGILDDSRETEPTPPVPPQPGGVEELPAGGGVTGLEPSPQYQTSAPLVTDQYAGGISGSDFGAVVNVSPEHGLAHVHFNRSDAMAPVGSWVGVYEAVGARRSLLAELQVVRAFPGSANVTGSVNELAAVSRGDVVLLPQAVSASQSAATETVPQPLPPLEEPPRRVAHSIPRVAKAVSPPVTAPDREGVEEASAVESTRQLPPASAEATVEAVVPASANFKPAMARRPLTASFMR